MAIFSIALRGRVILEELILRMSLSGRAILHRILPRGYILLYAPCRGSVSWGNTLFQEGNTGTVNFQYITFRNDIMARLWEEQNVEEVGR